MKNIKYLLEKHEYAPELTKLFIQVDKGGQLQDITSLYSKEKLNKIKNYEQLLQYIRKTQKQNMNKKNNQINVNIIFKNSLFGDKEQKFYIKKDKQCYKNLIKYIEDEYNKNAGVKHIINSKKSKKANKLIYDKLYNDMKIYIKLNNGDKYYQYNI